VSLNHIPTRDHVAGGELLEDYARQGTHVEGVHLHQVSKPGNRVLLGFADGVRAGGRGPDGCRPRRCGSAPSAGHLDGWQDEWPCLKEYFLMAQNMR
jgi:hypothetical protein